MFGAIPLNVIVINFKQSKTLHAESLVELENTITLSRSSRAWIGFQCEVCYIIVEPSCRLSVWTGYASSYLTEQFIKRSDLSKRPTRTSQDLNIPLFRSASGQRTFYYQAVSLWNSLDTKLKLCKSTCDFKRSLKKISFYKNFWLISNYELV